MTEESTTAQSDLSGVTETEIGLGVPARADDVLPEKLYLLPLATRPFFPAQAQPLVTSDELWLATIERIGNTPHHLVGLVLATNAKATTPMPEDFSAMGTVARIHHPARVNGKVQFIAEGLRRFRIGHWLSRERPFLIRAEYPAVPAEDPAQIKAYALAIVNTIKELLPLNPLYKEQLRAFLDRHNPDEASALTDFAAALTSASATELQQILETVPLLPRMEKVLLLLQKELDVAGLQAQIRKSVEEKVSDQQRQFFLREQLKAIQQELGISKDDKTVETELFRQRLEGLTVPAEAQRRIDQEFQKFSFLEPGSPEYAVTRNYLDVLTSLPWGKHSEDKLDLKRARRMLDRDHHGLEDVKERIVEFLAVGALRGEVSGSILLLVGPPGVGKSSIGRSIAEALGRKFYRFSLGGMRDEAEIKGHRRTYIGAMPGKFIQALRDATTANPLIMLDEIDKVGASYQGDPASALLEVLDPELNRDFLDHYVDLRFDLSKVLFVCTANQLDSIPAPLLDRMEVIRLPGYITAEKIEIARKHLWPRQRERAGVDAGRIRISKAAIRRIIEGYAREAGVRNLDKRLGQIVRKSVVKLIDGAPTPIRIGADDIERFLGRAPFRRARPAAGIGIATGLAWTTLGGETLNVEAAIAHRGRRGLKLTGRLGEVMRESAEIAYSYVAAHLESFGADGSFFNDVFVHLHVPEGATPKDGPSAGVTMATALLSLARAAKLPRPIAMTGELTLTGRVLRVGGIREKVIAARRARVSELILPRANEPDFDQLPEHIREGLTVRFADNYAEVHSAIFG
jgi:ATP-dependent Lon protease